METIHKWGHALEKNGHLLLSENNIVGLHGLIGVVQSFRMEPWFSSLWTLQKASFRRGAFIVTRDASTADENEHSKIPLRLKDLIECFELLKITMIEFSDLRQTDDNRKLSDLIQDFGFGEFYLRSPMNPLAAAHRRRA